MKELFKRVIRVSRREGILGIFRTVKKVLTSKSKLIKFHSNNYQEWIERYDVFADEKIENINSPLISIAIFDRDVKQEWLTEIIKCLQEQKNPFWELYIPRDFEVLSTIDKRIKSANNPVEVATGEWIIFLRASGLPSNQALFWIADAINKNPDARLIYADEDAIDEVGKRSSPEFKCAWNIDLFYSYNMIGNFAAYRTDIVKDLEARDYDLALKYIERINPNQIHHIARVLYHKFIQVDKNDNLKTLAVGKKALDEHFQRQKVSASAEVVGNGYRVKYELPKTLPLASLIIPTKNGLQLIQKCIESILEKTTYPHYEIIIVDNGSDDSATLKYFEELKSNSRVRILRDDRPFNYSMLNNGAAQIAKGEILGLLNNDLEVITPEWLSEMVSIALQPKVGAVGCKLLYPDKSLQHAGVILGIGGVAGHVHRHLGRYQSGYCNRAMFMQSFSAVTAACLIIKKSIYEKLEGLNEVNLQVAFNDVDFCLRVQEAGYRNVWTPYVEFFHYESATRGYENTPEKHARFAKEEIYMKNRWGDLLLSDPAYSPNLTLEFEDFSLAWPPRNTHES